MNKHLTLLGSAVMLSAVGLTACDSVTATNDKNATETAAPAVVQEVATKVADAPKAVVQAVKAATPAAVQDAATKVADAPKEAAQAAAVAATKVEAASTQAATEVASTAAASTTEATTAPKTEPVAAAAVETPAKKAPQFKEGEHYFEIFPTMQTDAVGGKVEVVELLWIGCPHCFALEPTIKEYKKNLPDYIDFKQIPAMLNPRWVADARTFYIADILDPKGTKKLVDKVFHAIHVQKRARMSAPDVVKRFMLQQGVTEDQFENAANSMVLQAKLNRGRQVSADSQAQSVPTLIINGRYRTSPYAAGGEKQMVEVVNMLTKREFEKK